VCAFVENEVLVIPSPAHSPAFFDIRSADSGHAAKGRREGTGLCKAEPISVIDIVLRAPWICVAGDVGIWW